jgi:ADP-heptose:LPS heptosyltransferase
MPPRPHVLAIRRRYLGDVVLLGSWLRNVRLHWPEAKISVLVERAYAGVLALNPDVDEALIVPARAMEWPAFLLDLRRRGFTHVFNFDNTEGTAALSRCTGAGFRLGLHHSGFPLRLAGAYTHRVNHPTAEHESHSITEYYLCTLAAAGIPAKCRTVRLVPREADLEAMGRYVGAAGPVLLVHPGSRSPWRMWPADHFAAVCDRAQDELGAQVVLVGGPGDQELIESIRQRARSHLLVLNETLTLPRFAALARQAAVFLGHDSGPMHIAASVGTPVVALYGSQNAVLFQPVGPGHLLLQPSLPCSECVAPAHCVPQDSYRNFCVRRLSVDEVFGAVRSQFARADAPRA